MTDYIDYPPDVKEALDQLSKDYYAALIAETYRHEQRITQIQEDYKHDKLNLMRRKGLTNETS